MEIDQLFLKYECNTFYKRVGPQKVMCNSDGTWSEVPTCKSMKLFLRLKEVELGDKVTNCVVSVVQTPVLWTLLDFLTLNLLELNL